MAKLGGAELVTLCSFYYQFCVMRFSCPLSLNISSKLFKGMHPHSYLSRPSMFQYLQQLRTSFEGMKSFGAGFYIVNAFWKYLPVTVLFVYIHYGNVLRLWFCLGIVQKAHRFRLLWPSKLESVERTSDEKCLLNIDSNVG